MVFCFWNCADFLWEKLPSERENRLKIEAEGYEFAKMLRSLEQFIWTVKGLNYWTWMFVRFDKVEQ